MDGLVDAQAGGAPQTYPVRRVASAFRCSHAQRAENNACHQAIDFAPTLTDQAVPSHEAEPSSFPAWLALLALTAGVAVVALACAAGVHQACFHPPPPVDRPDPGTPRGEYCAAVLPWHPWLSLTLGPCLLVIALWMALPRRRVLVVGLAVAVCVALIANAAVVNSLESALTI
jgi:hypothetical protein